MYGDVVKQKSSRRVGFVDERYKDKRAREDWEGWTLDEWERTRVGGNQKWETESESERSKVREAREQ